MKIMMLQLILSRVAGLNQLLRCLPSLSIKAFYLILSWQIVRKNSNKELDESEESFNEKKEEEQHDTEDYPDGIDKLTYPEEDNEIDDIIQRTDLDLLTNLDDDNESEEDIGESSLQPLKKRRRMMEVPYPIGLSAFFSNCQIICILYLGHAFNKSFTSVNFTLEEEFRIIDYLVRIQKYQNGR